ncbi:uncharacterized protein LOC128205654 [Mya arenaria]|uniref:uncharacterized protein LOC128205654 n=1 Tax=Mya arenaria TaxID=6604 RepID=UPI0022E9523E|nr:uncharacterized protein LOC128205654 [Mya arenaria]
MAFIGNKMFGHHMELEAHASQMGGHGFGGGHKKGSFGSGIGGASFGSSNGYMNDPNGIMLQQTHPELAQSYGHHGSFMMRQNSLLSEMTQSKSERKKHPMASSSFSYGGQENSLLNYSLFNESGHAKPKKPPLERSMSICHDDTEEEMEDRPFLGKRPRAPSFASEPHKLRSKTISTSSMPIQSNPRPKISRSMSISEDLTVPANMDIAVGILKRQQSYDAEKARRKSLQLPKKHFLPIGKRRKSLKSQSDKDSISGLNSETSSVYSPSRSRSGTYASGTGSLTDYSRRPSIGSQSSKYSDQTTIRNQPSFDEKAEEKLILSLMNDPVPEPENVFDSSPEDIKPSPKYNTAIPIDSPSLVSRRIQQLKQLESDNEYVKTNQFAPANDQSNSNNIQNRCSSPVAAEQPNSPLRRSSGPCSGPPPTRYPFYPDPSESDMSEPYYDCKSRQSSSQTDSSGSSKQTSMPQNANIPTTEPLHDTSMSTWTDGEDTTSTCDTPPIPGYPNTQPMYLPTVYGNNDKENKPGRGQKEAEKLRTADRKPEKSDSELRKSQRPKLKLSSYQSFAKPVNETPESEITDPLVPNHIRPDNSPIRSRKDHESGESSESGYATSHRHLSPKDYHLKVSQYVRSLPSNPDIDENHSESENGVRNGSLTDLDVEETRGTNDRYLPKKKDIDNMECVSGSESDSDGGKSVGNISESKLEIMKLLESPTHVRARVTDDLIKKRDDPNYTGQIPSPASLYRKGSLSSLGEEIKAKTEPKLSAAPEPYATVKKHVEVNCVITGSPESPRSERSHSRIHEPARQQSIARTIFERFNSIGRPSSASYETKSTSCIDVLLHFLNMLIFLSSAGIIGTGIWLLLKSLNVNEISSMLGDNLLQIVIYVAISGSSLAILASFCLCCGVRNDKNGLGMYGFTLVLVTVTFVTSAILITIFSDKLSKVEYKFNFKERLLTLYGIPDDVDSQVLTEAWDAMQSEFQCCGAKGQDDDSDSWAIYTRTYWFQHHPDRGYIFVPESCCKKNSNTRVCQGGDPALLGPPRYPSSDSGSYPDENQHLNVNGCYPFLASYLHSLSKTIALVTGSLAGLYFLTVMLTWVFCFKKNKDYHEYADSYYDEHEDAFNNEETLRLAIKDSELHSPNRSDFEETKFMNTPVSRARQPEKSSLRNTKEIPNSARRQNVNHVKTEYDAHYDERGETDTENDTDATYEETDENSEGESGRYDSNGSAVSEDTINRRNLWLTGSTGGHLLSTAIEEEDSNLDETDEDMPKQTAYV